MDFADSLFPPNFAYENDLDFSSLITPLTLISYQEPNPCNPVIHCTGIQNDGRRHEVCETTMESEIRKAEDEPKNKRAKHKEIERRKSETTMTNEIRKGEDEPKNKRAKHKEIERQRRQEASSLFKNLRYLLPAQYIKGKRSSSDHVEEAVNYIKDLKKKIKEVREKRDRIKRSITHLSSTRECSIRSLASSTSSPSSTCSCVGDTHIDIVVRPCLIGLEIVVSCCFRQSFLSSFLQLLAQEQCLNVVSCISTRLHQRFIHTIVSEVEEGTEVYFSELHGKIMKMGRSSYGEDTIVSNSTFERSLERLKRSF